jgi:hypothetical protein
MTLAFREGDYVTGSLGHPGSLAKTLKGFSCASVRPVLRVFYHPFSSLLAVAPEDPEHPLGLRLAWKFPRAKVRKTTL